MATKVYLSIITPVLNGADSISKTIEDCQSIFKNSHIKYEHIIVEGVSTDNTTQVLNSFKHIRRIKQTSNNGIYTAMNEGIINSKGKFLLMLNSGDTPTKELIQLLNKPLSNNTVYHGQCNQVDSNYNLVKVERKPPFLIKHPLRMPVCHQSVILPKEFHIRFGLYNTEFKYSSDYEFFAKLLKNKIPFENVNLILSNMPIGGLSDRMSTFKRRQYENFIIRKRYMGLSKAIIISSYKIMSELMRRLILKR